MKKQVHICEPVFSSRRLVSLADGIAVGVIVDALHKLRIDVALALYRHADALIIEHPDVVIPDRRVFFLEYRGLIYAAELCSALGGIEQIALAGVEQFVAVLITVLLLDLFFQIDLFVVCHGIASDGFLLIVSRYPIPCKRRKTAH